MADIVFVLIAFAFFALCIAYVRGCERLVGSDNAAPDANAETEPREVIRT